jgi:hypothetical protein
MMDKKMKWKDKYDSVIVLFYMILVGTIFIVMGICTIIINAR